MSIHTIWVPKGWSVEQVWEAIRRQGSEAEAKTVHDDVLHEDAIPTGGEGVWVNVDENGKVVK